MRFETAPLLCGLLALGTGIGTVGSAVAQDETVVDPYAPQVPPESEQRGPEWFYLDGDVGFESINLQTFSANAEHLTASVIPSRGFGPTVSLGTGFRLVFLTLGVRGHMAAFQDSNVERSVGDWQQWSFNGEVGFRIPLGWFEPHLRFEAGYTTFGGFESAVSGLSRGINVNGADIRGVLGFDYYLSPNFSLGLDVGGAMLALARPGVSLRDLAMAKQVSTINEAEARILEGNGTSVGAALTVTGGVGLHF